MHSKLQSVPQNQSLWGTLYKYSGKVDVDVIPAKRIQWKLFNYEIIVGCT